MTTENTQPSPADPGSRGANTPTNPPWSWIEIAAGVVGLTVTFLVYRFGLGVRGLGPEDADLVGRARELAGKLGGGVPPEALKVDHPLAELAAAGWVDATGGVAGLFTWITPLLVALAVVPVYLMARRRAGMLGGWTAAVLFAAMPAVLGPATSNFTAALFLATWTWTLALTSADRMALWAAPVTWLVAAALVLVWPPGALWLGVWLVAVLIQGARAPRRETGRVLAGRIDAASIPIGQILVPIAAALLVSVVHPGFEAGWKAGWKAFAFNALGHDPGGFLWHGFVYEQARPPVWTGLGLLWWAFPAALGVAAVFGWGSEWRRAPAPGQRNAGRLTRVAVLWGLPLTLVLPWLIRSDAWGAVTVPTVMAPLVAVAAGMVLARLGNDAETRLQERKPLTRKAAMLLPAAAVIVSLVAATARVHPSEGSHYNGLAGGLPGALDAGHVVSRDGVLPIDVVRDFASSSEGGVYAVNRRKTLEAYRKLGWLPAAAVHTEPVEAAGTLRVLAGFGPGDGDAKSDSTRDMLITAGPLLQWQTVDGVAVYFLERRGGE